MDSPASKPKVLMVDDDWVSRKLISYSLEVGGYEVHTLENSLDTVQVARDLNPSLILLDLMMPMKSGYTTLLELKAEDDLKTIPVIIMSAKSQDDEIQSCLDSGAADYLVKPVGLKELHARLKGLLEK